MRWVFVVEDNTKSSCTQVDAKNRGKKMHHIAVHPCTRTAVGEQITSVSASLFEVSSVYRISKLKCHQPTSAKTVFINAIHPLWIAAATTEKPGDIWYAAEKAIPHMSQWHCGFTSPQSKRHTMKVDGSGSTVNGELCLHCGILEDEKQHLQALLFQEWN